MYSLFNKKNRIYLITDRTISRLRHTQMAEKAITAGVKTIQLREKQLSKKDIYHEAMAVRAMTTKHKALFIMNDYIDIALAANADGVHLGQDDMPVIQARAIMGKRKIIGISTHSVMQAIRAEKDGADYIGYGPIFHTTTKDAGRAMGTKGLRAVRSKVKIPIVAIGGLTCDNISEVIENGADACAMLSGLLSGNIRMNVKKTFRLIHE